MKVAKVKLHFWDETQDFETGRFDVQVGDQVVVRTEGGQEVGEVVKLVEVKSAADQKSPPGNSVIRKVNTEDQTKIKQNEIQKEEALLKCHQLIKKFDLPMNLVDCESSFDGGRMIFTFTAESRVDFRILVRELSHSFQRSIRLQQIGIRDETKRKGDVGACGRELCCRTHLEKLGNVTSDLARNQQVAHRGSERISGACGRLMCCLAYEEEIYKECSKNLPALGSVIETKQGKGEVVAWNILKQTVDVKIDKGNYVEVPVKENSKCLKLQNNK